MEGRSNAFNARLAYELNCEAKYDYPDGRPSRCPKVGERLEDFAVKYGCSPEELKTVLPEVERFLEKGI